MKNTEVPLIEPWMISTVQNLLSLEYKKRLALGGVGLALKNVAVEEGLAEAKKMEIELRENNFTSVGHIWAIIKRLDEISEAYVNEFKKSKE